MINNPRISSLNNKHDKMEEEIRKAYLAHESDDQIYKLKKKKLAIKDEISGLEKKLN